MLGIAKQVDEAVAFVRSQWNGQPQAGLILGTGLGGLAEQIESRTVIPYAKIPHFPTSTAPSHVGQLVCGELRGVTIVAMEGRTHFYEGYSMQQVTFPVRLMKALGAKMLLVTNATGGLNPSYQLADVMIIDDQINLMGDNPLRGINDDRLGPRFPDMCEPYDRQLSAMSESAAAELGITIRKGVLVAVAGPNLETRAEYRMLRGMGADVVGMSTIPEVIVAKHAGMRVLGFSIITDLCSPDDLQPVEIQKILAIAAQGGEKISRLIPRVFDRIAAEH